MTDADFYRIRRLPPYVFAEVNAMKAAARARGEEHRIRQAARGVKAFLAKGQYDHNRKVG